MFIHKIYLVATNHANSWFLGGVFSDTIRDRGNQEPVPHVPSSVARPYQRSATGNIRICEMKAAVCEEGHTAGRLNGPNANNLAAQFRITTIAAGNEKRK
jgi:hypothetical protein